MKYTITNNRDRPATIALPVSGSRVSLSAGESRLVFLADEAVEAIENTAGLSIEVEKPEPEPEAPAARRRRKPKPTGEDE